MALTWVSEEGAGFGVKGGLFGGKGEGGKGGG